MRIFISLFFVSFFSLQAGDYSKAAPKKPLNPQVQAHYEKLFETYKTNPYHEKNLKILFYDKASLQDLPDSEELSKVLQTIDKRIAAKKSIETLSTLLRRPLDPTDVLTNVIELSENIDYTDEDDKKTIEKIGEAKHFKEKYINPSWKKQLIAEEEKKNKGLTKSFEKFKVDYKNKLQPFQEACARINQKMNFPTPPSSPTS
jgi:predicted RND superfamily exporter protein